MIDKLFPNFTGFFCKKKLLPSFTEPEYDISKLDSSLELLNISSRELIEVAGNLHCSLRQELKDTQTRLYSIIDSIEDFVQVKDAEGRWTHLNKYGEHLYNFDNDNTYVNKTTQELCVLFPQLQQRFLDCLSSDDIAWSRGSSVRIEQLVGNRVFDIIKTPIFNIDGSKKELIIVGRDITDITEKRKRLKACFNALNSSSDVIVITDHNNHIIFSNDKFIHKFGFNSYEQIVHKSLDIISTEDNPNFYEEVSHKQIKETWQGSCYNKKQDGTVVHCGLTVVPVINGVSYPIYYIYTMKAI
jgi:PAS domain S-box-containing protein